MKGKNKGSEFERSVSKKLSRWISKGERDDLFWRTQNSGGRFTVRKKVGKGTLNQEGDITSTSPETTFFSDRFYVECKSYVNVNIWSLITENGLLYQWCYKYLEESKKCNKILLLVVKQNNKPILVLTPKEFCIFPNLMSIIKCRAYIGSDNILVFKLDDFLKLSPEGLSIFKKKGGELD